MAFGRISDDQWRIISKHVKDRVVHDLGAGRCDNSLLLLGHGAKKVVAVDKEPMPEPGDPRLRTVRTYFDGYRPNVDVAFVAWPINSPQAGLVPILRRAKKVIYVGKNTDGTMCAWPGFWHALAEREVLDYAPEPRNTLIVYGDQTGSRPLRGEEIAGIDCYNGDKWMSYEEAEGLPEGSRGPDIKKNDRIVWNGRAGTVMDIDTSAQNTPRGRSFGWQFAAWVLFDDRSSNPNAWSCVNAFDCKPLR